MSSFGTVRSRTSRPDDNAKSNRRTEKEETDNDDEKQEILKPDSDRQGIMNELKNNILTHYQSIYQKEDNLLIDRNFRSLRNVGWFIRILFLALVPLNIIIYIVGPLSTFTYLQGSINDIFSNEDLRRSYIRCHNAIDTLILNNTGVLNTVTVVDSTKIQALVNYELNALSTAYTNIVAKGAEDEWTTILYKYAPEIEDNTSMNYQGSFTGSLTNIQNAMQKLTNALFKITSYNTSQFVMNDTELTFYRINSLQKFNSILGEVTTRIFKSLSKNFDRSENLSIIILLLEGLLFFISLFIISRLILIVIWSLREILAIFTAIDDQQIAKTEEYYQRLLNYLLISNSQYISTNYDVDHIISKKDAMLGRSFKYKDDKKQKAQKKSKNVESKQFMRKDTFRILFYYIFSILLCFSLSLVFHFQSKNSISAIQEALLDGQKFIELSPVYITSLIGLKELALNTSQYQTYDLPYMQDTVLQLEKTLNRAGYATDLEFVKFFKNILDGTPCLTYANLINSNDEVKECLQLGLGRLSSGLISFHNYYSDIILNTLTLNNAGTYGSVGSDDVYEFGELIKILDDVFLQQTLSLWKENMKDYISSKNRILAVLIALVSILNLGVYFIAQKGVVGILEERFLFYRKIYNEYMLGEAPVKEKRIKAVLVKYKLINK